MSSISLLTIYSVGLYLPEGVDISGPIPDVEKILILEYHLDVPKEKVVSAIRESVYANPDVNATLVESDFQKLSDAFDSPMKGDRYEFPYIPGQGTAMIKSHKIMTSSYRTRARRRPTCSSCGRRRARRCFRATARQMPRMVARPLMG